MKDVSLSGNRPPAPELTGSARDAVRYRGGHLQIIAAAGSGKTEVVSQRVADLLADGLPAESIVAFTFTERAAEELSNRIAHRVEDRLGVAALDRLAGLFVGTIHAFCFRLLQQRVPRYETYDVLDDNQLTAFLSREANRLGIRQLDQDNRLFASIAAFLKSVDVVENELLDPAAMPDPFGSVLRAYYETLDRYRLLTYGQQVVRAVRELERPELAAEIHARLRHLIVDEYQDVNPAQERLIELLTGPQVDLCVVGDDQQAIYQWRGSDVSNIVRFPDRYPPVATFEITTNRRSRPQIIEIANRVRPDHPGADRQDDGAAPAAGRRPGPEVVVWSAPTEVEEAGWIANLVLDLADKGARLPRHRGPGPEPRRLPAPGRAVRHLRHPGPARRPLGPVRPARGGRPRPHLRLAGRHRMAGPLRPRPADHRGRRCSMSTSGSSSCPTRRGTGWRGSCAQWKAAVPRTDRPAEPHRPSSTSCSTSWTSAPGTSPTR